jgi:hypothetical protein
MIVAAAAGLLFGAPGSGAQASARASVHPRAMRAIAGCYHLTVGAWSKKSTLGPSTPTTLVKLDTLTRDPALFDQFVAVRLRPAELFVPHAPEALWQRPALWQLRGADSVEIVTWSTGTEAEVYYGRIVGARLRGVLRHTSDAIPGDAATGRILWDVWPWAPTSAERVPCP